MGSFTSVLIVLPSWCAVDIHRPADRYPAGRVRTPGTRRKDRFHQEKRSLCSWARDTPARRAATSTARIQAGGPHT
ncbi:hypothetical protein GCM10009682_60790 [Luedemannella flava]|uniref:Secreted protein n=1 Tax=Luedemannella flava TaxID=349316 RepID=A0ABN2MPY4_9ACTN